MSSAKAPALTTQMARLATATQKGVPMISVPDIAATLAWYKSIGFSEVARFEDDGVVNFGMLSFGKAELMLRVDAWGADGCYQRHGNSTGPHDVSLWFYTEQVDELYRILKSGTPELKQERTGVTLEKIEFVEDLYDAFYGARQFSIRDLNGYTLVFLRSSTAA